MILKLDPSSRLRRRYLLINGNKSEIENAMQEYLGILGMTKADPIFVEQGGKEIILAVNRDMLVHVKAAFSISKYSIDVLKVSGTLKGLKRKP